jgi:putative redox protein
MEMVIDFPGGKRVDAHFGDLLVKTDQPTQAGGTGSAATPFDTFLASIGTCAGIYIVGFCSNRNIPTEGIKLIQRMEIDPATGMLALISLDIQLPSDFPEKYKDAVIRAADQCKVKKHMEHPPKFQISANIAAAH